MPTVRGLAALAAIGMTVLLRPMAPDAAPQVGGAPASSGRKLALLVGIARYSRATGWGKTHADNDLALVRSALAGQGFLERDIRALEGPAATREGIVAAFRDHLLERAGPGDVAVFHYSGHGHRLTDDGGDEIDGYDEVLVPYDAPRHPPGGYPGDRHLRDDELNRLLLELRRRVGPGGDILVSLDACFSGTATRGEAVVRGDPEPIGPPRRRAATGPGGEEEGSLSGEETAPTFSYVAFSASRRDELSHEVQDEKGRPVGPLSLAFATALSRLEGRPTYRDVFDHIRRAMAVRVANQPQAEGDLDREIFGGRAVVQAPFFEVWSHDREAKGVVLGGGTLAGLEVGARLEIHRPGARSATPATRIARAEVESADWLEARARLTDMASGADPAGGWAFVTAPSFGELRVGVRLENARAAWARKAGEALARSRLVLLGAAHPTIEVRELAGGTGAARGVIVETVLDARRLLGPLDPAAPDLGAQVRAAVQSFARNEYLRQLELRSAGLELHAELIPCRLDCQEERGDRTCTCPDLPPEDRRDPQALHVGAGFKLRLRNAGLHPVHVTVLDLMPDGRIDLLWPNRAFAGSQDPWPPGRSYTLPTPFRVSPPLGTDVLKVFATMEPVDFRPITTGGGLKAVPLGPLDALFEETLNGTRGPSPPLPAEGIVTRSVVLQIRPQPAL